MLEPGAPAPDFTLDNEDGESVSLSDYRGHRVALYVYPKADTSFTNPQYGRGF